MLEKWRVGGRIVPDLNLAVRMYCELKVSAFSRVCHAPQLWWNHTSLTLRTSSFGLTQSQRFLQRWTSEEIRDIPFRIAIAPFPAPVERSAILRRFWEAILLRLIQNYAGTAGTKDWVVTRRIIWWFAAFVVGKVFTQWGSSIPLSVPCKIELVEGMTYRSFSHSPLGLEGRRSTQQFIFSGPPSQAGFLPLAVNGVSDGHGNEKAMYERRRFPSFTNLVGIQAITCWSA